MSNRLTARRVMFQDLKNDGTPDGPPTYGVVASDDFETRMTNDYESFEALNAAIQQSGCILNVLDDVSDTAAFSGVDRNGIGVENYHGSVSCL